MNVGSKSIKSSMVRDEVMTGKYPTKRASQRLVNRYEQEKIEEEEA